MTERPHPYIWVTYLTGLLCQDKHCELAPWLQAHFKDMKEQDDGFDLEEYKTRHRKMLRAKVAELKAEGKVVWIEDQNWFSYRLKSGHGEVSGKLDIVAIDLKTAEIHDCKSGKKKSSDYQQILIYMLLGPLTLNHLKGHRPTGYLHYLDAPTITVPFPKVTKEFMEALGELVEIVGGPKQPEPVPSWKECQYCKIPKEHCAARIEEDPNVQTKFVKAKGL